MLIRLRGRRVRVRTMEGFDDVERHAWRNETYLNGVIYNLVHGCVCTGFSFLIT
jgi:hypothetical protein